MNTYTFGPLTPEQFQQAVDAPYGGAAEILRSHDPMWGKFPSNGEKIRWKVQMHQQVTMAAIAYVEAETAEEAWALAEQIDGRSLTFDTFIGVDDDSEVYDVVPA